MAEELTADSVARMISEAISSSQQTNSQTSTQDRMGDIGGTERLEKGSMDNSEVNFLNAKRTFDTYQNQDLQNVSVVNNLAHQALQNAIETANMVGKQAVRNSDFAVNKQWNINETDFIASNTLRNAVPQDAIAAAIAKAVQDAVAKPTA